MFCTKLFVLIDNIIKKQSRDNHFIEKYYYNYYILYKLFLYYIKKKERNKVYSH